MGVSPTASADVVDFDKTGEKRTSKVDVGVVSY